MITAVILSWKRPRNIFRIVSNLNRNKLIDEIIIWNNNPRIWLGWLKFWKKVLLVNTTRNCGMNTRFAAYLLAKNNLIFQQDDDILVPEDAIKHLYDNWQKDMNVIHGVWGRNPNKEMQYNLDQAFPSADIVLGRLQMFHKKLAYEVWRSMDKLSDEVKELLPQVGGDIFFSYMVMSLSGRQNIIHNELTSEIEELPAPHGIWKRQKHKENRTAVLRECLEKFSIKRL